MQTKREDPSRTPRRRSAGAGFLGLAGFLLAGVLALAYGYFRQNAIGLYGGLVLILAGVLNGVVWILARRDGRDMR